VAGASCDAALDSNHLLLRPVRDELSDPLGVSVHDHDVHVVELAKRPLRLVAPKVRLLVVGALQLARAAELEALGGALVGLDLRQGDLLNPAIVGNGPATCKGA
jgi:hypothetical protein